MLKCCLLSVTSIYTLCHYGSLQNLPLVIRSVKKTHGDVGHKNGIRVALYFVEVRRGVLGVESGVNAIILLGGSQAFPDRPSDHKSTKKILTLP